MAKDNVTETSEPAWVRPAYQERSRQQRDRLLKAGERVFAESGFWQAHVAQIAKKAGCSVGSFYRRFHDKEALFLALQAEMAARAEANIGRFFADPACASEPLETVFARLARNTARGMKGIEGYYRALFELSLRGHDVWPPMRRIEELEARQILGLLEARGLTPAGGGPRSVELVVRMMHGHIISTMLHGPGPYGLDDAELYEELAHLVLRHLGVPDAAAKAARAPAAGS
jgi:AcrR family transcriptional regulator